MATRPNTAGTLTEVLTHQRDAFWTRDGTYQGDDDEVRCNMGAANLPRAERLTETRARVISRVAGAKALKISRDTISLVRDRTDIAAVISESVPSLKKHGRRMVGLCPFHVEKTPSFHVNSDSGLYYCFGCKESGDVFRFLERAEGYTFVEAVKALAERAGVAIEEDAGGDRSDEERRKREREALLEVLQLCAAWYEEQLALHPLRASALDELQRRSLRADDEAVKAFRVGYAPPSWDALATFLKRQGISPAVGESLGLLVPRANASGYYDRFRNRLMFAVVDAHGQVVAFSGRALPASPDEVQSREPPPKYINSPESSVYVKGATLFGLWQARHAIRKQERAVLVEGNFDVVSLHARGLTHVVAPLGTAFTIDQAKLLRRYAPAVTLLFDGDAAGRKATRAAEDPCFQAGLDANVALLPDRTDPDEFVRTKGHDALSHVLSTARGLLEYLLDVELDPSFGAANALDRAARVERVASLLARQNDPVVRGMLKGYADYAASRLDLVRSAPNAFEALERKVFSAARGARVNHGPRPFEARIVPAGVPGRGERKAIVGAVIEFPALLEDSDVQEALTLLEGESARIVAGVRQALRRTERGENVIDVAEFLAQMPKAIQAFATARLAAPAHDTLEDARATVTANARKLRETNVAQEANEMVREQHRVVGDWDAELALAKQVHTLVSQRQGVSRKE
ncbi:MAG: DNA primase [Polyangiaceae bacterium]